LLNFQNTLKMTFKKAPLSSVLPPLIFGTATFNYQYVTDPYKLPTTELVHKALSVGVRAFDTSPYYGPAEEILGNAFFSNEVLLLILE
jgi:D-arabinose 1-dehydrogenase